MEAENPGDGDFEVTAEMLIHGDLDDESTLSEEEIIDEGDSDELDELQNEGELPLEVLLARYGYGEGPPEDRSGLSDSSDCSDYRVVRHDPVSSVNSDGAGPSHVTTSNEAISSNTDPNKVPDNEENSQNQANLSSKDDPWSPHSPQDAAVSLDPKLEPEKEEKPLLGKRQADPVINDVMLSSKRSALMPDTNEATSSSSWIRRLRRDLPERRAAASRYDGSLEEAYFNSLMEDSDASDDDFTPFPREDWKQDIKVGAQYQASVPEYRQEMVPPDSYQFKHTDVLKWRPRESSDETVSEFLSGLSENVSNLQCDSARDNEEALEVLQNCDHNVRTAIQRVIDQGLPNREMDPFSESECQSFEEGLRLFGKNFYRIQKQVPTRTVKELIQFYYIWKKSERNDLFVQQYGKIGKKRTNIPAGQISDFMNKCLDVYNHDSPDLHYSATTISAESKRDNA